MENYTGDDNLDREVFRKVNEAQKKIAKRYPSLVINSLGARLGKCLLNPYENKGSMNTVFNFPLSAFAFLSNAREQSRIKNEDWIRKQAEKENQDNPSTTPYKDFISDYDNYLAEI